MCCNAVQHGQNSDALLGGGFLCPFIACVALSPCCCAEKVRLRRHLRARYGIAVRIVANNHFSCQMKLKKCNKSYREIAARILYLQLHAAV
jgi:hypothetical protein